MVEKKRSSYRFSGVETELFPSFCCQNKERHQKEEEEEESRKNKNLEIGL